jgi:glycosyltransferase involved in cell wall biosynthesis
LQFESREMKILVLAFGDENCASTWYRILQYKPLFEKDGIVFEHTPARKFKNFGSIPKYDLVILQKPILSVGKVRRISRLAKRFVYDADDRIWLRPFRRHGWIARIRINARMRNIAKLADTCMAANSLIARDLSGFGAESAIVPMALDGKTWYPMKRKESKTITIGWTGAPVNLPFLKSIIPSIKQVLAENRNASFAIHCGEDPCFHEIKYDFIPFEKGKEPEVVRSWDIGLLPLPNDEFAKGKSPIKALQYLASGVAMVCSKNPVTLDLPEGRSASLYADKINDWHECIKKLIKDQSLLNQLSKNGREQFEADYELSQTYPILRAVLAGRLN